jgi:hypothetical protein
MEELDFFSFAFAKLILIVQCCYKAVTTFVWLSLKFRFFNI